MRMALSELAACGPVAKIGRTYVVEVKRKDGTDIGANAVVTFRTRREADEFASAQNVARRSA